MLGLLSMTERQHRYESELAMMRHIDLCSGIGGFALGFEQARLSTPVLFCDIDAWCRKVLAKHWPHVRIAEDVKELANEPTKIPAGGRDTILTAGYPCQSFSQAGKRRGEEDDRYIWPYIREIVAQKRPAWCVFENVYGHVSMGLDTVLSNLEADGYATRPFIVPACGVDAPHRRDRVWIIGRNVANTYDPRNRTQRHDPDTEGQKVVKGWEEQSQLEFSGYSSDVTDTASKGLEGSKRQKYEGSGERFAASGKRNVGNTASQRQSRQGLHARPKHQEENSKRQTNRSFNTSERGETTWQSQSSLCGVDDGLSTRLDRFDGWEREPADIQRVAVGIKDRANRLKGLGNAIVPQIAMRIGLIIKEVSNV